jgi:hypothetical protein
MYDIECKPAPTFSDKRDLIHGKPCYLVKKYSNVISFSVKKIEEEGNSGYFIKLTDKNGNEIEIKNAQCDQKELESIIKEVLLICRQVGIDTYQCFLSADGSLKLVDLFDGKSFVSPGMIEDIFSKRVKTQTLINVETYDQDKSYDAIIKPTTVCYDNEEKSSPLYVMG